MPAENRAQAVVEAAGLDQAVGPEEQVKALQTALAGLEELLREAHGQ